MSQTNQSIPKIKVIDNLSPEHRAMVDTALLNDKSVKDEVIPMMMNFPECEGLTFANIQRALYRYKNKVVLPKQVTIANKFNPDNDNQLAKVAREVAKQKPAFDPLKELESLAFHQMERVSKLAELESKSPALLESQTKNIVVLATILEKITNYHHSLGILKHAHVGTGYKGIAKNDLDFVRGAVVNKEKKEVYDVATLNALESLKNRGLLGADE